MLKEIAQSINQQLNVLLSNPETKKIIGDLVEPRCNKIIHIKQELSSKDNLCITNRPTVSPNPHRYVI